MTAIFEIELPDGNILEIEAPENTQPEQIKARARQYIATQSAPRESAFALQQRAMRGDQNALAEYNRRAQAAGQNTIDQERAANNPTVGNDNFLSGVGSAFSDTGMGLKQVGLQIGNKLGLVDDSAVAGYQRQIDRERQLQAPLMDTNAGMAGVVAGNVALWANPVTTGPRTVTLGGKLLNATAGGALAGLVQPTATGESRLQNTAIGGGLGAGGQLIGSGLGRAGDAIFPSNVPQAVDDAKMLGLRLGAGELTDNPSARTIINQLERLPFSGASARKAANNDAFSRAAYAEAGEMVDKVTPDTFGAAKSRIGQSFTDLAERNSLNIDRQLVDELSVIRDDASRLAAGDTGRVVSNWIDELVGKADANGVIPGKAYKSFDSKIGAVIRGGGENAFYLGQVRDSVRRAMDKSISPQDAAAWRQANKQYGVLKTLEPLAAANNGAIPPTRLLQAVTNTKSAKARVASGNGGNLARLARVGQLMKSAPDSGTADRALVNLGVLGGLYGAQETGIMKPETALAIGGALALNRGGLSAANRLANNPQAIQGLARQISNASQRALPVAGVAATAGIIAPTDFNEQLMGRLNSGAITKQEAANELDAYLQTYTAANGVDGTRYIYQQFPEWASVLDN